MATITIDVPDDISAQLDAIRDRLPELLALSLHQPALPSALYRTVVEFLAGQPTPAQLAAFAPPPETQERLRTLLARTHAGQITPTEQAELDEYAHLEHAILMIKASNYPFLRNSSE